MLLLTDDNREVILKVPERKTLIELFESEEPIYLSYHSGCKDPIELATGIKIENLFIEPVWRINSNLSENNNLKLKLGGYFKNNKEWENKDKKGTKISSEMAGIGICD